MAAHKEGIAVAWGAAVYRSRLQLSCVLCALILAAMAVRLAGQPLIADEVDFALASQNWAQYKSAIFHPPGYVALIQLSQSLFGRKDWVARLPGIVSTFITLLLIPALALAVYGDTKRGKDLAVASVWLFTLSQLAPQNMILLDIDNTVLTTAMLAAIWLWYRLYKAPARQRIIVLALVFSVSLWFKLVTPMLVLAIMVGVDLWRREWHHCASTILAGLLAGLLFSLTFALYSYLADFPMLVVLRPMTRILNIAGMAAVFPQSLGIFFLWLGPFLVAFWGLSLWRFIRSTLQGKLPNDDLLQVYAACMTLVYAAIAFSPWYYPKYQTPALPVIVILAATCLVDALARTQHPVRVSAAITVLVLGIFQLVFVGDPLRRIYDALYFSASEDLTYRLGQGLVAAAKWLWPVPIALLLGLVLAFSFRKSRRDTCVGIFGAAMLSLMLTTTLVQLTADYSTRYLYGQSYADLRRATDLVKAKTAAGDYIVAPKSVMYYAGARGRYVEEILCPGCGPQPLLDVLRDVAPAAVVWSNQIVYPASKVVENAAVRNALETCYSRHELGDFVVLLRFPTSDCIQ